MEEDQRNYIQYKTSGEKIPPNQTYSQCKTTERAWLKECPSQILRNSTVNWYTAKQRFFKGLAKNPRKKKRGQRDSVLLTRELFSFHEIAGEDGHVIHPLHIGTKKHSLGYLSFTAHREYKLPNQIVISKKHEQGFVSFCYQESEAKEKTEAELREEYAALSEETLKKCTIGIDRGIVIPFKISDDTQYDVGISTQECLFKKQQRLKRYQRKLARQQKASQSRNKTKRKIGKLHRKIANIRHDFCHKVSYSLTHSAALVFAVEDLSLRNMTKSVQPKQDNQGRYIKNGRKAKSGLNRELLAKGLGKTIQFLEYKARRQGKLVIKVAAHHTSQECAACGHIDPANRPTQSVFMCLGCGNQDHADSNAAKVIAKRGIQILLSKPPAKTKTRLGNSRSKARRGRCQTKRDFPFSQVPMTLEALPL